MQFSQLISLALLGAAGLSIAATLDKRTDGDTCFSGVGQVESAKAGFYGRGQNIQGSARDQFNNLYSQLESSLQQVQSSCGDLENLLQSGGL